ncbi:MAG: TetR/AcrR family transcriptional regulator [Myxococcales bacterium]|nr:TetR/AcrR family transcriptional regulator [Myxococcales bacterium]
MTQRPARERSYDLREQLAQGAILAAAIDVFTRLGVAKARVEDVLVAAGVSRRTFYKRFRSKEDLLLALYEAATAQIMAAIRSDDGGSRSPRDAFSRAVDVYLDVVSSNGALAGVLLSESLRPGSPLAMVRRRFRDGLIAEANAALREASIPPMDPTLGLAVLAGIEGLSIELVERGASRAEFAHARAVAHELVRCALDARPTRVTHSSPRETPR